MEIVSTIIGSIAQETVGKLFNAASHQFSYFYKYDEKVEALRKETKKLEDARDSKQKGIRTAERRGESIEAAVQTWIKEVDSILAKAKKLLEDEVKANKKCLGIGCCFMDPLSRYRFSKEAQKKTLAISELQEEGNFANFSSPAPPPGIISSSMEIFRNFKSRKLIMQQIMKGLNDENVSIIGICGMGGVGKTMLVKEIGHQAKLRKLFDEVAMAVVSRNTVYEIQEEIANMLTDTSLPPNPLEARARYLWARIKRENKILIILDDLWERIELDKIGIPSGENHKGCKIVVTSRSKAVCNLMVAKPIEMRTFSKKESWDLFKEVAGLVDDNSDINAIARKVADKCDGLPLAILTVGRALMGRDEPVWKDAEQQLNNSRATYIEGIDPNIIASLELSYNFLKSQQEKSLFLFCCLFPEDFEIPIELLGRYGLGLNWFVNVDKVEEARNRAHAVVSTLASSFLLINDKKGFVKMHDVARDVAIAIASKNNNIFMAKPGMKLRDWPSINTYEDLTGISLMLKDLHDLPDHGLECPKLEALLLQLNSSLVIPSNWFQGMINLKVLDLSDINLLPLPQSLRFLANLRTLCLSRCKLGDDLSVIGELSRLEILNLSGSDIKEIPASFGKLSGLRLLDMNYCQKLKLISPGVVSRFAKLEELYMLRCFPHWNVGNNARIDELKHLSQLIKLMIHMPTFRTYPNFQKLKSFTLSIGGDYNEDLYAFRQASRSREVMVADVRASGQFPDWVKDLLNRSENIILESIQSTPNIIGDLVSERFTDLNELSVKSCYTVKYLIDGSKSAPNVMFPNLKNLTIGNCHYLVEICHGLLPAEAFRKLTVLTVHMCKSILQIVPSPLLQRLKNLRKSPSKPMYQ